MEESYHFGTYNMLIANFSILPNGFKNPFIIKRSVTIDYKSTSSFIDKTDFYSSKKQ